MTWGFYGRGDELQALHDILSRGRWFFARITGRRRIGKTTLVQRALSELGDSRPVLYVQIPDSAPAGVLSSVGDAMQTFGVDTTRFPAPSSLHELATLVGALARAGYLIAFDEFQYFSRKRLYDFTSYLQAEVDQLSADAGSVPGGLFVLGSLHAELVALLEDRHAPLYNRTTDDLELDHLDIASVLELLEEHADAEPERLLFLWNLFEGVPKFYRDCYEQGALAGDRGDILRRMFFRSSSPLRSEAEHWFLGELHGRYDAVLKFVARHPGCNHADIENHIRTLSPQTAEQVGGHLKILLERYRMIERRLPVFAPPKARRSRYYVRDNFLRAWLDALQGPVSAINFRPETLLVEQADASLESAEGHGLERLAAQLYEERARKGVGDFALTRRIDGYWDRGGTELDLVAVDEEAKVLRIATCKRSPAKLVPDLPSYDGHIERFLADRKHREYRDWKLEKEAIAPRVDASTRTAIREAGYTPRDLVDLTDGLRP